MATLVRLLRTGVTCARVDLSWGTKEYHQRSLRNLAEAMQQTRLLCRWGVRMPGTPAFWLTEPAPHNLAVLPGAALAFCRFRPRTPPCLCPATCALPLPPHPPTNSHSVWLDTTGREVVVRRPIEYDASGWPRQQDQRITVEKDQVG